MIIPRWSIIRRLAAGPALRYTSLIPVIGTILVLLAGAASKFPALSVLQNEIRESPHGIRGLVTGNGLIPSLLDFYFGLTFLGFFYISYTWFCPNEVSDYGDVTPYISNTMYLDTPSSMRLVTNALDKDIEKDASLKNMFDSSIAPGSISPAHPKAFPRDEWARIYSTSIIDLKSEYFRRLNENRPVGRLLCLTLFGIGLSFTTIPTIKTLYKILTDYII